MSRAWKRSRLQLRPASRRSQLVLPRYIGRALKWAKGEMSIMHGITMDNKGIDWRRHVIDSILIKSEAMNDCLLYLESPALVTLLGLRKISGRLAKPRRFDRPIGPI